MLSRLTSRYRRRLDVRLTVNYTAILLGLYLLLVGFFLYRLDQELIKQVDRLLHDESRELAREIMTGTHPERQHTETEHILDACRTFADDVSRREHYPIYFRVLDLKGGELFAVDAVVKKKKDRKLQYPAPRPEEKIYFSFAVQNRSPFRCYQNVIKQNGRPLYVLQLITPASIAHSTFDNMLQNMLLSLPVVLVLGIILGQRASRRPFAILRRMNDIARRITAKNLQERLPVPEAEGEVRELTETINDMLERLEAAFNETRQFTADVAHELRNPLAAVQGEMEVMLSRERTAPEYREVIGNTLDRISGIIKIVNDLFLIARFDNRKVQLSIEPVDFSAILRDLYDFFDPVARDRHIGFTIGVCDAVTAPADRIRMQQLISNLIDNALKFTPADQSVTLELERHPGSLVLQVRDTGIGIAPDEIPKIFMRFYQVDKSRSGSERGSGLGLQICKRIAEAHGGEIRVTPNVGKGVTFALVLPLAGA